MADKGVRYELVIVWKGGLPDPDSSTGLPWLARSRDGLGQEHEYRWHESFATAQDAERWGQRLYERFRQFVWGWRVDEIRWVMRAGRGMARHPSGRFRDGREEAMITWPTPQNPKGERISFWRPSLGKGE